MSCVSPANAALTSHYYIEESSCGVTPSNPAWKPLRYTSGNMQLNKDSISSAELDGSREVADIRLGQNQTTGDISIELSYGSYDDLLGAALGGTWVAGGTGSALRINVDATAKTFTRLAGDWTTDVSVGDIIKFSGYTNPGNNGVFYVVGVTSLVLTVAVKAGVLVTEAAALVGSPAAYAIGYTVGDTLGIGTTRRTFSILTHFADAGGGSGEYHLTTGVEITGYSFDVSVNAIVTGSLSTIGRKYESDVALPAGSTFPVVPKTEVFAGVDGRIFENDAVLGYVTSMSFALDNAASAQFEIGSDDVSFIEIGRANSTLSLSTFFYDSALLTKFINETETKVQLTLAGNDGTMAVYFPRVVYTSGTPEVSGEGSITQTFDAQALRNGAESSVTISRIA